MVDVVIIGAGFSGTMTAYHLMKHQGVRAIALVEPGPLARGVAYGTQDPRHLLNVRTSGMSALPQEPSHFLDWMSRDAGAPADPDDFAPRRTFGRYFSSLFAEARESFEGQFEAIHELVTDLHLETGAAVVKLASGRELHAHKVVLALGNFPPAVPRPLADPAIAEWVHSDPWRPEALAGLKGDEDLLLIGTGLTSIDVLFTLEERGHRGKIHLLARHALFPRAHTPVEEFTLRPLPEAPHTVTGLMRWVREEVTRAEAAGQGWRDVIDAMRPYLAQLWQGMNLAERRRFMRHVRLYWDVHRHRMPPASVEMLERLEARNQMLVHAGHLLGGTPENGKLAVRFLSRHTGEVEALHVDRVLNCTGPQGDYRRLDSALVRSLLKQGLIQPDALGLGLETAPDGAVLDAQGKPSEVLYTLGPARKAGLWESIAVPELRGQAENLAQRLLEDIGQPVG
jgi:uncharacterized NAD(P)/FAD-binding protein YdhS